MATQLGKYLNKLNSNKSSVAKSAGISRSRMNDLCNSQSAKIYADEFYKIIVHALRQTGLPETEFQDAIDSVFPGRRKIIIFEEFSNLSPEGRLFRKYTQKQFDLEEKLGMPKGKLSKYFNDKNKRALANEIITLAEGMKLDVLSVFKEVFGEI